MSYASAFSFIGTSLHAPPTQNVLASAINAVVLHLSVLTAYRCPPSLCRHRSTSILPSTTLPTSLPKLQRTLTSWMIVEVQSLLPRMLDLRKRHQQNCTWDPLQLGYMRSFRSRDDPAEHVTLKQPSANLRYLGITCTLLDFDLATSTSLQLFSKQRLSPKCFFICL